MEETQQQQKLPSAFSMKGVSLKQGIRSVMNSNRLAGGLVAASKDGRSSPVQINDEQLEEEHTELSVEDLASIPRVVGDLREASLELTDSASQLRTSLHKKYGSKALYSQDSPRGPGEWGATSGGTATTAATSSFGVSLQGSDSNLPLYGSQSASGNFPISPVAASSPGPIQHPHSAPQALQTSGPTPKSIGKKGLLRKKIKMSAIKTFVGKGLDLSSSSHHVVSRSDPSHAVSSHKAAITNSVGFAEEPEVDHGRREDIDLDDDDDFASPQQSKGVTGKMASKMRKSLVGWKAIANMKGKNTAAVLLEDDITESTDDAAGGLRYDAPPPLVKAPSLENLVSDLEDGVPPKSVNESKLQVMKEAKSRRREKHMQRNAKRLDESIHLNSSNHASDTEDAPHPRTQRTNRARGKLNPEAKQRLRKHSESNELRNRSAAGRLRRQQVLASSKQDSDRSNKGGDTEQEALPRGSSHSQGKHDEVSPTPVKGSVGSRLLRAPSGEGTTLTRKAKKEEAGDGESHPSARKLKKREDEKLRGRVRRQSLLVQVKEPSYSVLDIMNVEDDASFAEDLAGSMAPVNDGQQDTIEEPPAALAESDQQEGSLNNLFQSFIASKSAHPSDHFAGASVSMGGSSSNGLHVSSSASLDMSSASAQGSFQRVESVRTADYLQLKIDGLPLKGGLPQQQAAEGEATAEAGGGVKKKMRRRSSKSKLMDDSMGASEPRRPKGCRKHSTGEKKEGSRRGLDKKEGSGRRAQEEGGGVKTSGRKPRAEKSSRHRTSSPRRHSEQNHTRRRKAAPRGGSDHASMQVLPSVDLNNEDSSTNLDMEAAEKSNGTLGTSISSNLATEESNTNLDASSGSNVLGKGETDQPGNNEEGQMEDSKKEVRRHATKEKRGERKRTSQASTESVGGETKHSVATTVKAGSSAKQRSLTRGRSEGMKEAPSSSRGRSEAQRDSKRVSGNKAPRRHSMEAKKRMAATTIEDDTAKLNSDLGKSLTKIKW